LPPHPPRPIDATLTVTKAARLLGVHPNTVRAWSDAGRLRYYRINPRGDRRYRLTDLQRFLAAAAKGPADGRPGQPATLPRRLEALPAGPIALRGGPAGPVGALAESPDADEATEPDHEVVAGLAALAAEAAAAREPASVDELLTRAARVVLDGFGLALAVTWRVEADRLVPVGPAGPAAGRLIARAARGGTLGRAINAAQTATQPADGAPAPLTPIALLDPAPADPVVPGLGPELAVAVPAHDRVWGVLLLAGPAAVAAETVAPLAARMIGSLLELADASARHARLLHRADALRRVAGDLLGRLDLDQIVATAVDHALVLFGADRGAVHLRRSDGSSAPVAARRLSSSWLGHPALLGPGSLPAAALAERRPVAAIGFRDDPRAVSIRAAVVQEGFDTLCAAPLFVGPELIGMLTIHHDRRHHWSEEELDAFATFAAATSVAIRTARNYSQMATWAAQLQSIQQLGARLNRLTSVGEIGLAIANELRQLIDYHNVRVYRQYGDELIPVAMQGQVGEYVDETPEQLKVRVGEGITGWVALHKLPQSLPDAAKDPRANTIPGTEDDLDESMLLAPMVFEDQVIGVLVLSKLGLRQFSEDDLRLLVIYASFAAQAMANADATELLRRQSEALERQVRSQRVLLQITESILTTLDARAVLDQIADRLEALVGYDNISIEVYDRAARILRPLTARGANAEDYLQEWEVGETGVATWVIEHNEPVLIVDQFDDPRVQHFPTIGPVHGGLIVVPLRGRDGVTGVLTVERLGEGNTFTDDEFELIKLFAAQVSIALQNAEIHSAVEIRARTDDLTGLLNHGTFRDRLAGSVARDEPFGLVMIDLDDFKQVNDALGHQAGDRLLSEIARAIVAASRDTDQVFRYGGDEFAILLPGAEAEAAAGVAERVRAAVHAVGAPGTRWSTEGMGVSASFGVATYPEDGATADEVLLAADRACFVAKRKGAGLIATADEGLALAAEFSLQEPTPVDPPTVATA
jgi:diguanylate cyclase (GGDEF)-like protein/excisionase family DNA binding protein